jgi:hypothetical protein
LAELWYNCSLHFALGCSPFKALYGYEPNIGAVPSIPPRTSTSVVGIIEHRELHLQSLKEHLARSQNRMKLVADTKRKDHQFSVGDKVLLKLQPYTQSTVANRPYPQTSIQVFWPLHCAGISSISDAITRRIIDSPSVPYIAAETVH